MFNIYLFFFGRTILIYNIIFLYVIKKILEMRIIVQISNLKFSLLC